MDFNLIMMQKVASILLFLIIWGQLFPVSAQNHEKRCYQDRMQAGWLGGDTARVGELERFARHIPEVSRGADESLSDRLAVITVPVVVHVIHSGEPVGIGRNLSPARIQNQIEILNEDFRRGNSDSVKTPALFQGVAADARIEFCLASLDPSGNPTDGITRHQYAPPGIDFIEDSIKPATYWDSNRYLNVWTAEIQDTIALGYAFLPTASMIGSARDGVVVRYEYFGSGLSAIGTGRTTTHEIGHYLGLSHIWADVNNMGGCMRDDGITDTPLQEAEHFGCPAFPQFSCGSEDMFMNFMEFVDDSCMNLFTLGQIRVMRAVLTGAAAEKGFGSRADLIRSGLTGCMLPPPVCFDLQSGPFSMGFEEDEDFAFWTVVNANMDTILPPMGNGPVPNTWEIRGPDTMDFEWGPHSGNRFIVYFWNGDDITVSADDWFFTPCLDLQAGKPYELRYWAAVAGDAGQPFYEERLEVILSELPDPAFFLKWVSGPDSLVNPFPSYLEFIDTFSAPAAGGSFHLGFHVFSEPNRYALQIDDILLRPLTPNGIHPDIRESLFTLFPNPASQTVWIAADLAEAGRNWSGSLSDAKGRLLWDCQWENQTKIEEPLPVEGLAPGMYYFRLTDGKRTEGKKLVILAK
jgi:hypothetical protein